MCALVPPISYFFFFQAEDGIRDIGVTGVQTCALPILKRLALPDVQLPDGHQGDLVFGLVLQDLLIFRNGLRDLALIQELLCGFDVFAFAIGHSRLRHSTARACWRGCPPRRRGERQAEAVLTYASRRRKGKSTKADFRVSSQLSPLDLGTRWRKPGEPTETPA